MILLIDNFDSFTYNLRDYILQTSEECIVRRNDEITIEDIELMRPEGIILSPGPGKPSDYPALFNVLDKFHDRTPFLGVCLGFQAIGEFFGMLLTKALEPRHGKTSKITHDGKYIFDKIPNPLTVTRYHSLILSKYSGSDFEINSLAEDGVPMAGKHRLLPVYGVQFHPEAILTEHGLQMIKNWVRVIKSEKY